MKRLIFFFFTFLICGIGKGQVGFSYSEESSGLTTGCDDPGTPIYSSSVNYAILRDAHGKPTSIRVTSKCRIFDDVIPPSVPNVNCSSTYDIFLPDADCYSYSSIIGSCTKTDISLTWEPSNLTITGSAPGSYCQSQKISLIGPNFYKQYVWQYQIGSGNWTTLKTTSINTTDVSFSDITGLAFKQFVNFRYSIGNCSSVVSNVIIGYSFLAAPVEIDTFKVSAPRCVGGDDGSATDFTFKNGRIAEQGEYFTVGIYNSQVLPGTPGSSTVENEFKLKSQTYYALAESNYGNCGAAQWLTVIIPAGPRTPLVGSATVTSLYNGSQIKCNGESNAEITVTASGGKAPYEYSLTGGVFQTSNVLLSVEAGAYNTITIRDSCPKTYTTSVPVSPPPALVLDPLIPSYCNNTTTSGKITVTKTGGTGNLADYSYSYDGGAYESSAIKTGLSTGSTHFVTVKDKNDCVSLPRDIVIPNPLSASSAVTNPACGTGTGKITISGVTGGNGSYTYSLNGAAAVDGNITNGNQFTSLSSGPNSVTLFDAQGCNTSFSNLTVTVPSLITVTAPNITPESCVGKNDGTITTTALNAVGSIKYSLNGGTLQASNVFAGQPAGSTYYITVKEDRINGCTGTSAPITIGQVAPLTGTIVETTSILCHGDTGIKGAALDLTPSGGTPNAGTYVYGWTKGGASIASSQDVSGIPAGTYSVTITDKKLCSTTLPNIIVNEPALLTSSINKSDVSCNPVHGVALSTNGAINLTPSGGVGPYHFEWSNSAATEDLPSLAAGTYTVKITDDNGCIATNSASLLQPLAINSLINLFSDVTCKGLSNGSITINASGGTSVFSYSANGSTWQSSSVFNSLPPATYTLITKDGKSCTSQNIKTIAEPNLLIATVSNIQNTTCGNSNGSAQVNVTGGNGNYKYAWKNIANQSVSTSNVLSNASGDTYAVMVTDSKNCSDSKVALISNSDGAQISINKIDATSCYDSRDGKAVITVTSGAAPYAISWSNAETGLTPAALLPGDNIVRVNDANNCVVAKLITVPSPEAIAINTQLITPPTCAGSTDAGIALTMKGGNGSYTYAWGSGQITSSISNVVAGDYSVTVKDIKNCAYTSSIKIDAIEELKLTVTNEKLPTCFDGSDGTLTVNATGGNGSYGYQWTNGQSAAQLEKIKAGSYTVKVKDIKGCNLSSSFVLSNPSPFAISIEDKTICVGQKYKIASDVSNGTYMWTSTKGFSSTKREVTLTNPDTYTLKVINAQGCSAQDNFELKTSTDLLHADLLMISEAYQADTVVVIDLSWPLPEAITWLFPTQASVVEQNNELGYAFLKFNKTGQYNVAIRANLGECVDTYSQAILIKEGGVKNSAGRQSTINVIQYFEVHPNPNKGDFTVVTDLYEMQSVRLMLINTEGNKILLNLYEEGKASYNWNVSLPELTQGTYFLVLKAGKETKAIRMMKL